MRTKVDDLRECKAMLEAEVGVKVADCLDKFSRYTGREVRRIEIMIDDDGRVEVESIMGVV